MDSPGSQSSRSRSRSSSPGSRKSRSPARSLKSASTRSRSSSRSGSAASRSRSRSHSSAGGSSVRSRSGSGSRSSSPRFVSATPSGSDSNGEKKSGNASSVSAASSNSSKGKRRLKAKERKVSSQLAAKMDENSDEDEDHIQIKKKDSRHKEKLTIKAGKKDINKRSKQKTIHEASEEGEVSSEDKEFDDGLDEDLMGNEEDRDYLEGLTEKEREEELFKRAENREQLKKRFEIQKKLRIQQKLKGNLTPKKRKSLSEDDEPSLAAHEKEKAESGEASDSDTEGFGYIVDAKVRAQDRQSKINSMKCDKKTSALSELRAKRQEQKRKTQQKTEKKQLDSRYSDEKSSSSEDSSDNEAASSKCLKRDKIRSRSSSASSGASEDESSKSSSSSSENSDRSNSASPERRKSPSPEKNEFADNQEDLERIRLSRFKLERFVNLPFFKQLAVGCFARIGIGKDIVNDKPVYRCVEITDVIETAKVYMIGRVKTNIGLKIKHGLQEKVYRLVFFSNDSWNVEEFDAWKSTCEETNVAFPTLEFVNMKFAEIQKACQYEISSEDVDQLVASKEQYQRNPVNYAMYKARLMKEKELAIAEGDESKSGLLETKLNEIEERAEELDRRRTHTISSVALINDRNRKANVSKAEEAIRLEMRREKKEGKVDNPFKRRKCNPRMVTKVSEMDAEQTADQGKVIHELKRKVEQTAAPNSKDSYHAPEKQAKKNETDSEGHTNGISNGKEDLFDAHNFDIEIDVDTNVVAANPVNVNLKPVNLGTKDIGLSKRSLNLDDYKKKRGLI